MNLINISFDYELLWGQLGQPYKKINYKTLSNVLAGEKRVHDVITLLNSLNIPTTWGLVAATTYKNWLDIEESNSELISIIQKADLINFKSLKKYISTEYLFSSNFKNIINNLDNLEIVSHGGFHLYLEDININSNIIQKDITFSFNRLSNIAKKEVSSIIFPRNQIKHEADFSTFGIDAYRPNPKLYHLLNYSNKFAPLLRLFSDIFFPSDYFDSRLNKNVTLIFLRLDRSNLISSFQIKSLKTYFTSYKKNSISYLYIHPHNINSDNAFNNFKKILEMIAELKNLNVINYCDLKGNIINDI